MWERFGLIPSVCACGFTGVCGSWALPGCLGLPIETLAFVWMRFAGPEMFGSVGVQWPEPPHPPPPLEWESDPISASCIQGRLSLVFSPRCVVLESPNLILEGRRIDRDVTMSMDLAAGVDPPNLSPPPTTTRGRYYSALDFCWRPVHESA